MPTRLITFRVTPDEKAALMATTDALGVNLSQLVEISAVERAHRAGFYSSGPVNVRVRPDSWKDSPPRRHSEVSATERMTIYLNPINLGLVKQAAEFFDVPASTFILGCLFRFISD